MTEPMGKGRRDVAELSTKCYLLDMPGELRNLIYSFAKEEEPITFYSSRLKKYAAEDLDYYGIKLSKTESNFVGLTETCPRINQEYAAIYASEASVHVSILDVNEYMDLGLPHLAGDTNGNYMGNLFIDHVSIMEYEMGTVSIMEYEMGTVSIMEYEMGTVSIMEYEMGTDGRDAIVEFSPLLAACRENPDLQVRWDCTVCSGCGVISDLQHFFELSRDPDLGSALIEAVTSVTMDISCMVDITFKNDSFDEWVTEAYDENSGTSRYTLAKTGFAISPRTELHRRASFGVPY